MKTLFCAINAKYIHTNLAVRSLCAFCKEGTITEFTINDPLETVFIKLLDIHADLYCFSCYLWNIEMVKKLCELLKKSRPYCRIVLGGPEVSYEEDEIIQWGTVEHIVLGEGEFAMKQLLDTLHKGKDAPQVIKSEAVDINVLPFPYESEQFDGRILYYEASRGCPFSCGYCLSAGEKLRLKGIETVKRDIAYFVSKNVKQVKFLDRTFNADRTFAREIFKTIIDLGGKTNFHMEIGGHLLDNETMELLQSAPKGLFQFEIGVQSTNSETLFAVDRKTDIAMIAKRVKQLKSFGNIHIHLDLIAGLPKEDLASFKKSFQETYEMEPDMLQLGFLKLLKGSKLRQDAEKLGIVYAAFAPYEVICTPSIPSYDLNKLKKCEKGLEFYNTGRYQYSLRFMAFQMAPFDFYVLLGERLYSAKGALNLRDRILELFRAGIDAGFPKDSWKEIVRFDYVCFEKPKDALFELGLADDPVSKEMLYKIQKMDRIKNRQMHVERFLFDVPEYLKKGHCQQESDVYYLFNYREKTSNKIEIENISCRRADDTI